jgi:hypothetical protein
VHRVVATAGLEVRLPKSEAAKPKRMAITG